MNKLYYVCVKALGRNYRVKTRSEQVVAASSTEACNKVVCHHKNLGITPTEVSMFWLVWPQPETLPSCSINRQSTRTSAARR